MSGNIFADLTVDTLTPSASVRDERQSPPQAGPQKSRRQQPDQEEPEQNIPFEATEEGVKHKIDRLA